MPNGFPGRGSPVSMPRRQISTLNGAPQLGSGPNTKLVYPSTGYADKPVTTFNVDLTNIFVDMEFALNGSLVYFSGQTGGTAAPMGVKFNRTTNGKIPIHFGDSLSGIPFDRIFISNPTAQPGVVATFNIIQDSPRDRVALPL